MANGQTPGAQTPKRKPKRRAAKIRSVSPPSLQTQQAHTPQQQAGATPEPTLVVSATKAPPYLQGIRPQSAKDMLAQATPDQLELLKQKNFALWARFSGLEVDHCEFEFDKHRYLLPLYLDNSKEIVMMKAAQMGATIYMLLRLLWFCRYHTLKCGLYFPTADGVNKLSKDRLSPLIKSNRQLEEAVNDDTESLGIKQISNIHGKISSLYMLYLGGTASKDSVPLDVVGFDEVRLVEPESDIDQALERISHSRYKIKMFMSTAGFPGVDVHRRFLRGTQHMWHIKCNCLGGLVPSDCFPDCIVDTGKEVYIRCPKCKMRITDPQNGEYIAHNPGADIKSYHISQFISKFITPKEIWESYLRTQNKKEFYNAKLGKPFVDEENMPINEDVLQNCVNEDLRWAYQQGSSKDRKRNCAMGVDQHSGNNYVVIMKRGAEGKKEIVHLELIESANPNYFENGKPITPFKRLYELMKEFDVGMCLVDALPNANEAQDFARAFPTRVFITWYAEGGKDMVSWHDRIKHKEAIRRGSKSIKLKWQVTLNRYQSLDFALRMFTDREVEMPHPDALLQVAKGIDSGRFETEAICRQRFWLHLKSLVRQKTIQNELTGIFKMEWVYLGRDPHFVHSFSYANVALERLKRKPIFVFG